MDRLLRKTRFQAKGKGLCGTRAAAPRLRHLIPIRTGNEDIHQPGYLEADSVAHCGNSLAGNFVWSLTFTDVYSQWTENRAIWNKGAEEVLGRVKEVEKTLPFILRGFDVDNGSEFLTFHLWCYFLHRPVPVDLRRSRPYKKNDQAYVEEKNWTHVRQLLGYERIEKPEAVVLMNDLYRTWGQLHNFFLPTLKLKSKKRYGGRLIRKYDRPLTPCQRLLKSRHLTPEQKKVLQNQLEILNPIELKNRLEEQLKELYKVICPR